MMIEERAAERSAVANDSAGHFGTITVRQHDLGPTSVGESDARDQRRCRDLDRTYSGPAIRHSTNTCRMTIVDQAVGDVQVDRRVGLERRSGFWTSMSGIVRRDYPADGGAVPKPEVRIHSAGWLLFQMSL